jgi:hypothetical protein
MNSNRAVVIDRWVNKDGKHTSRYGVGQRWRARFVDDQGKEQTKAFARKADARAWLDDVITRLGTGSYTDPEAGRATVASVYAAWSAAQAPISPKTAATRRSFCELSTPAGGCCSGAPVSLRGDPFRVVGVYVGERRNFANTFANTFAIGFATRSEVLAQQWPQLVDGTTDLSGLCPFDSIDADWTGP